VWCVAFIAWVNVDRRRSGGHLDAEHVRQRESVEHNIGKETFASFDRKAVALLTAPGRSARVGIS